MNHVVRRKLEMAARVREFCRAHPSTDPGYELVLGRLEERLARAQAIAAKQVAGRAAARAARAHREELRRVVHSQLLRYLVAVGSVAAKTRSELAERFRLPDSRASNQAFVSFVKALLATAEAQRELLVSEGMGPTLLEDLGTKVSQFEAAAEAARTGRREHIEARADLEAIVSELTDTVRVLDGMNRYRFGSDPELMTGWAAARDVPGARRREVPGRPSGEGDVTPGPGEVAPGA